MNPIFKKIFLILLLTNTALFLVSCASSQETTGTESDRVSNIPWNKPQSWEGGGALGGALGGGR